MRPYPPLVAVLVMTPALVSAGTEALLTSVRARAAEPCHAVAMEELRERLHEPDPLVRAAASRALGRMGPCACEAGEELARLLDDDYHDVAKAAATALDATGMIGLAGERCLEEIEVEEAFVKDVDAGAGSAPVPFHLRVGASLVPTGGTVWLFPWWWGGTEPFPIGVVEEGRTTLVPDEAVAATLAALVAGPPDFVIVAIELPGFGWYRSEELPPGELAPVERHVAALAEAADGMELRLPMPERRRIRLADPDGRPRPRERAPVAVDLGSNSHCGGHDARTVGTFESDEHGVIDVVAPPSPLCIFVDHYKGSGDSYGTTDTLVVSREAALEARVAWEPPGTALPVTLRVTRGGAPVAGAVVTAMNESARCGFMMFPQAWAETGDDGCASAAVHPSTLAFLDVEEPGGERTGLTEDQEAMLLRDGFLELALDP